MRRSRVRSVQSSGSDATISSKVSASAIALAAYPARLAEQRLVEQEPVQRDDQRGDDRGDQRRDAAVDERPHDVGAAREQDERHERERDPERQDDLADYERPRRV